MSKKLEDVPVNICVSKTLLMPLDQPVFLLLSFVFCRCWVGGDDCGARVDWREEPWTYGREAVTRRHLEVFYFRFYILHWQFTAKMGPE